MNIDFDILKRYLEDRGAENDKQTVINWFNNLKTEKKIKSLSNQYWDQITENIFPEDYDETMILGRIYRQIKQEESIQKQKKAKSFRLINTLTKIAAVLFIPLLIIFVTTYDNEHLSKNNIIYSEIYSPPGARTMFYLPDGSKGWLNGGSYLKFPERFQGKTRNVSLKGEAFFDVFSNPKKPFIVEGKNLNIVARGTSFNVQAWQDEPDTEITLVEGKIDVYLVDNNKSSMISRMEPGELLHFIPKSKGNYIMKVDVEKYTSWTEGKLVFRDDPFSEVVERINRWYNVNLIIKDDILKTYRYVATFEDESLDEILKMLKLSAPISYRNLPRKQNTDGKFEKRIIELYYNP